MTRSTIHAIIKDGPRAGETVQLDAAHEGVPPKEFLLADERVTAVIPGTSNAEHMADNLGAMRGRLPNQEERERMVAFAATL